MAISGATPDPISPTAPWFGARLAAWIGGLAGWRRALAAAGFGALATLALSPVGWWPALFPGFIGLLWLLDGAGTRRRAFWAGWWFGLGHHAAGLYWIANALLVDVEQFWWLIPFAVLGLPALLGLFTGTAAALARTLVGPGPGAGVGVGVARAVALAAAWTLTEYARGTILSGFPWNLIGYAWVDVAPVAQTAALVGVHGLGLATLLVILPLGVWAGGGRARVAAAMSLALGLAIVVHGLARLSGASTADAPGVTLRIVQPNVPQTLKWDRGQRQAIFEQLLALSRTPAGGAAPSVILWPETAVPYFLETDVNARAAIAGVTPPGGHVITGSLRVGHGPEEAEGAVTRAWNSVVALDDRGDLVARYDKAHLVPFGEYVPARRFLPLRRITQNGLDFSPGPGARTLAIAGLPAVGPLVCYEVIFPDEVVDSANHPEWLLEVTNDGWFGGSAGPYQHFAMARSRSIEQGVPMVIAANTGISGVIDPYGRVRARSSLGRTEVMDGALPAAIAPPPYARWGDLPALLLSFALGIAAAIRARR